MNDDKVLNVQEELLNAMYTIAKGVVAQQNYDETKVCKVVEAYTDNKGVKTGVYKVQSQDAIFDALAQQGAEYFVNQMVYVSILNGDYDNDKFIVGQKVDKDDATDIYNLKLPFDDFLGLYNLTEFNPMVNTRAYWANCPSHGDDQTDVPVRENGIIFPKSEDHVWHWENVEGTKIYATKLGLEVDVMTLLHGYNLISGHYGLRIVVDGEIKGGGSEPNSHGYRTYEFSNDMMYGNPYAYTAPSTQQIVVDVSEFLRIDSIDVWFTQDHNFRDEAGNLIPYGATDYAALLNQYNATIAQITGNSSLTDTEKQLASNEALQEFSHSVNNSSDLYNISFQNLHCLLGMTVDELKEEEVILYTYDAMSYGIHAEDERIRAAARQLNLAWVHATPDGVVLVDTYEQLAELKAEIYWYKYDKSWAPEHEDYDIENISHKLGGNYWRPFDPNNVEEGEVSISVIPDREMNKQRYKVVIRCSGSSFTSNVLIFTNTTTPETDKENLARNDKIILRCAVLAEDAEGNTTLLPDDAIGNFFVYNENNHCLANDDNILFSNVRYYIEPWIRPGNGETDGSDPKYGYQRLADYTDEDGKHYNFNITWQFPESFTMIRSWGLLDDNARNEYYWNQRSDFLFERDKVATRYFYIEQTHNVRYNDNEISAIINIEGMGEFTAKKDLLFGRAGAFGCEYTPVIFISEPAGNYYVDTAAPFELYCLVYDRQGRLLPEADRTQCKFAWKYYGTTNKPADNGTRENYEGFLENVIRGRITVAEPFVAEVTVSGAAEYDITVRRGIMVCNNATFMHNHDIVCPDRVEFRSDGQTPFYASNPFEVQKIVTGSGTTESGETYSYQNELIYPEWKINNEKVLHLVQRTAEYPTFTLPNGNYVTRAQVTQYGLQFSADVLNTNIAEPVAIGQQWTEDLLKEDYFTYIYFTYNGVTVAQAIAFAQNLYPSSLVNEWDGQSLALDEENGSIIAKMIAAGTKDQRNRFTGVMMGNWSEKGDESLDIPGLYGFNAGQQSFGLKTDGTGFIGPSGEGRIQFDGRNALISNSSKTCYINLNPRRITDYLSPDGTGYVINNQAWDAINNQSISQYFLYTQTPRRVSTFANNDSSEANTIVPDWMNSDWSHHEELMWVDRFFEDDDHDYFIVDPSYGVMTTGGIFARYGKIGKNYPWVISDYGLTQKNIFGRIFLGNPEKNLSDGTGIPAPTFTNKDGDEETVNNNFFSASFSNASNIIQSGIRADGYLYTKFAAIGGWYVNDSEIYAVDNTTFSDDEKKAAKGFRKTHTDDGYKNDLLNINSKNQFIAFNNGKFVINGKHGWMGFYSDTSGNTISLDKNPDVYNMLINFATGDIGFGKMSDDAPYSYISGTNGSAYFSKGQIQIDGDSATIYCGVSTDSAGIFDSIESITTGTLYLAGIQLQGITSTEQTSTDFVMPDILSTGTEQTQGSNDPTSTDYDSPGNGILPFNIGTYESITDDGQNATEAVGNLQYLTNFSGNYYLSTTIAGETYSIGGKGYFSILHPNNNDYGVKFYIGDNNLALVPTVSSGYLLGWNLESDYIIVNDTLAVTNVIDAGTIFMKDIDDNAKPISALVATQIWVNRKIIDEVWPKIKTVNNLASAAMKKAEEALNRAIKAMNKANANATELTKVAEAAICKITYSTEASFTGCGTYSFLDSKGNVVDTLVIPWRTHGHKHTFTFTKGILKEEIGGPNEGSFTTEKGVDFSAAINSLTGNSDTGQLSWTTYGGATGNFNIADTTFFKARAFGSFKAVAGGGSQGVGTTGGCQAIALDTTTVLGTASIGVVLQGTGKNASIGGQVNKTTVCAYPLNSYYDDAYDAGYEAGWKAAANGSGRADGSNKVTYPSSTVGEFSSQTASLGGGATVLTGYTTYNRGNSISLYTSAGDVATGASRVWRYGGSTRTRYSSISWS